MTKDLLHSLFEYRDGVLFWKIKPSQRTNIGDVAGGDHGNGHFKVRVNGKKTYVHRVVFMMHHGFVPKYIDHIDGNPSNNRVENLRAATHSENIMNKKLQSNNSTGVRGVHYCKKLQKFRAEITVDRKKIPLGLFSDIDEASRVYADASKKYHGEFSRPIDIRSARAA